MLGFERLRARPTGRVYETEWADVFTLREGKIVMFREYADTAAMTAAYGLFCPADRAVTSAANERQRREIPAFGPESPAAFLCRVTNSKIMPENRSVYRHFPASFV